MFQSSKDVADTHISLEMTKFKFWDYETALGVFGKRTLFPKLNKH